MSRAALALLLCGQMGCLDSPPASTSDDSDAGGPDAALPDGGDGKPHSLQFFGNTYQENGIDRVWLPAWRPNPVGRVGDANFTVEMWLKAEAADIPDTGACPSPWWMGTIVLDREFYDAPQNGNIGMALYRAGETTGVVIGFTVAGPPPLTLCGDVPVADGQWHHVAMTRDNSDKVILWIDGHSDAAQVGPPGDGSFAMELAGETEADRYLVLGGPKQEGDVRPGFTGFIDDLRISNRDLYDAAFIPPAVPLEVDILYTLALHTFDEGAGNATHNLGRDLGDGELRVGGDPTGPVYSDDVPAP